MSLGTENMASQIKLHHSMGLFLWEIINPLRAQTASLEIAVSSSRLSVHATSIPGGVPTGCNPALMIGTGCLFFTGGKTMEHPLYKKFLELRHQFSFDELVLIFTRKKALAMEYIRTGMTGNVDDDTFAMAQILAMQTDTIQ
jgi:hypothetical protein